MTVADLRAALAEYPDDTLIVLSEDGEGNGFSPLALTSRQGYTATATWMGDVSEVGPLTPALAQAGYDEDDVVIPGEDGAVLAVVLWPTR